MKQDYDIIIKEADCWDVLPHISWQNVMQGISCCWTEMKLPLRHRPVRLVS